MFPPEAIRFAEVNLIVPEPLIVNVPDCGTIGPAFLVNVLPLVSIVNVLLITCVVVSVEFF